MNFTRLLQDISLIEVRLGHTFFDKELLALAFVHRSYVNENKGVKEHNERLEFLGDSVLGLLIAEYLYRRYPEIPEGQLSLLRSRLVDGSACSSYMQKLDLEHYFLLGKGERRNDGRGRESILADVFEAIIGAIYLDGGLEAARTFLFGHFADNIDVALRTPSFNWKALLQDYCQQKFQMTPGYRLVGESGPDHNKIFKISVVLGEKECGRGSGSSKKEAQQAAAADAIQRLQNGG